MVKLKLNYVFYDLSIYKISKDREQNTLEV
jgi:hypothetical protein